MRPSAYQSVCNCSQERWSGVRITDDYTRIERKPSIPGHLSQAGNYILIFDSSRNIVIKRFKICRRHGRFLILRFCHEVTTSNVTR